MDQHHSDHAQDDFFLLAATLIGYVAFKPASRLIQKLPISQGLVALTLVVMFLYGWAAEEIGQMAAITGAFLAGLLFGQSTYNESIEHGISPLAFGFFVPIFFIGVGLQANMK